MRLRQLGTSIKGKLIPLMHKLLSPLFTLSFTCVELNCLRGKVSLAMNFLYLFEVLDLACTFVRNREPRQALQCIRP